MKPSRLLVLDVEGTIFETPVRLPGTSIDSTIWQAIAFELGPLAVAEEVATHRRWASGGYASYLAWMRETILIHRKYGLRREVFERLILSAKYNGGVAEAFDEIDRSKFECVLLSGGFRELARRAQMDLGIHHAFAACEYLFSPDGLLQSFNLLPCDFQGKVDFVQLMLREYGLGPSDWIFVGDGLNDSSVAAAAPVSIGYRAHPELAKVATYSITSFHDLLSILKRT